MSTEWFNASKEKTRNEGRQYMEALPSTGRVKLPNRYWNLKDGQVR